MTAFASHSQALVVTLSRATRLAPTPVPSRTSRHSWVMAMTASEIMGTANNIIGGSTPQTRNIISGNGLNGGDNDGVYVVGVFATGNRIERKLISGSMPMAPPVRGRSR